MSTEIDESLYSRQLYVLGHEAMKRMLNAKVLLIGSGPLALEIAKNVCLGGVHSLTLTKSEESITEEDLGCHFYFTDEDIGKNKVEIMVKHLAELNPYVPIHITDLTESIVNEFDLVVLTSPIYNVLNWAKSKVILALVVGLFAQVFCDFGEHFILDKDGEELKNGVISNMIVSGKLLEIVCLDEHRHGLEVGNVVKFSEIVGLNLKNEYPVKNINGPFSFSIECSEDIKGEYEKGGIFTEVKVPFSICHKSFQDSMKSPNILPSDFAKMDRQDTLHCCFVSYVEYFYYHQIFDEALFRSIVEKTRSHLNVELQQNIVNEFIHSVNGECPPLYGIIGGFVAQEVLKKISGKFTPLDQYFYLDALECKGDSFDSVVSKRYARQYHLFGDTMEKLFKLHPFVVGSGAIGCELLKNLAMMGVGTKNKLTLTDMDTIEKSNLNRQFLFRAWDVSKLKSVTAANAASKMNPDLKIDAKSDRVGPETEKIFGDSFFDQVDVVLNALDNWEARRYMDQRCVYYQKPLLESGTLGTKGNIQVVVPFLTESFSSSNDPPEKSIPMCTLHNFPNKIEHTIQFARSEFEGLFKRGPEEVLAFKKGVKPKEGLKYFKDIVKQCSTFEECVQWARLKFEDYFGNTIKQLLHVFPKDVKTKEGHLFWSGPKRAPHPILFDIKNSQHLAFITSAANLRAVNFGIKPMNLDLISTLENMIIPEFIPKTGVKIQTNENEKMEETVDEDEVLPNANALSFEVFPIEFEKDDDSNYHIDFITATSNLRAENYDIESLNKHETKRIAGKIIPAIATTTACVSAFVCLELYKVFSNNLVTEAKLQTG
eukprot:NODE_85_length_22232_cov_1.318619.p1 type:complete len:826 gc:universal NODE_85_length_22232_cov_1.318619:6612-4135(-)